MNRLANRSQHGAIGLVAAAALFLATIALAMGVDLGRIAWQRRELQRQADAAALAGSLTVGSCVATPVDPVANAQSAASENGFTGTLLIEHGTMSTAAGLRQFTPGSDLTQAEAVRVTATRNVLRSRVLPTRLGGTLPLRVEAVAQSSATGALAVGSFVADVDSDRAAMLDALLSAFLGSSIAVSVISYEELASATISIEELALAGSVDEDTLLSQTTSLAALLGLISDALTTQGEGSAAATLGQLEAAAVIPRSLELGNLLVLQGDAERRVFESRIRVLDLVMGAAQLAWEDETIAAGPVDVALPGVTSISLLLRVVEAPQIAIGRPGRDSSGQWRTVARTAAIRAQISITVANALTLIGSDPVELTATFTVAQGEGALRSILCARAATPVTTVVVDATPGTASLAIGAYADIATNASLVPAQIAELTLLGTTVAEVSASSSTLFQDPAELLAFDSPFVPELTSPSDDNTRTAGADLGASAGSAAGELESSPGLSVNVLGVVPPGVTPGLITSATEGLISPILDELDELIEPLAESLGIHVGGLDVTVMSVNRAQPELLL